MEPLAAITNAPALGRPNDWPPSSKPFRSNPPDGSVGIAIPIRDGLKFFKLTFYSVLDFTDWKNIVTLVDNMSGFQTVNHLDSLKRNHNINVLQYQEKHNLGAEANLAFRFMFSFAAVRFGALILPGVVLEPFWASRSIRHITGKTDLGLIAPAVGHQRFDPIPENSLSITETLGPDCLIFRREVFEGINGFSERAQDDTEAVGDFCRRAAQKSWKSALNSRVSIHRFNLNGSRPD